MKITPLIAVVLIVSPCMARARDESLTSFDTAQKEALRLVHTSTGHAYVVKFLDAMDQSVGRAMRGCMPGIPGRKTDIRCNVVFIVSSDGRIERILRSANTPVCVCFIQKLQPPPHLPKPPHDYYPLVGDIVFGP